MDYFRKNRLRFVEFNVENLFILLDQYDGQDLKNISESQWQKFSISITPNKPLKHVFQLADAIREMNPDILMLCEVGGRESLQNFSQHFLNNEYAPYLIEGNSDRGIDIGYLVRKSLPFRYDLISHKHRAIDFLYPHEKLTIDTGYTHLSAARMTSHRFSRDVLELRVFEQDQEQPAFVILLVHLKSQLDRSRIDPQGRDRRRAELEKLLEIQNEIREEFGQKVPVLIAGDLNGVAALPNPNSEFEGIYSKTYLQDCLEVAGVIPEDRFTYMQLSNRRPGLHMQLDYIFLPPEIFARVNRQETWVFRFQDQDKRTFPLPRNLNEKRLLPSDHYPIVLTLNPAE